MEPCDSLVGLVRNELNHILTENPFVTQTGGDFGWFCREHAFVTALLLCSMGYSAQICRGDIVVKTLAGGGLSTFGLDADHAWCVIDCVKPIDLRMTLRYLNLNCDDVQMVCGSCADLLSGFELHYFENIDDAEFRLAVDATGHAILYNEKLRLAESIKEIADDPFSFLIRPPIGTHTLLDSFGENVFYAITAHLLKLIRGEAKPLYPQRSAKQAIQTMVKWNPEAKAQIEATL